MSRPAPKGVLKEVYKLTPKTPRRLYLVRLNRQEGGQSSGPLT